MVNAVIGRAGRPPIVVRFGGALDFRRVKCPLRFTNVICFVKKYGHGNRPTTQVLRISVSTDLPVLPCSRNHVVKSATTRKSGLEHVTVGKTDSQKQSSDGNKGDKFAVAHIRLAL